MNRFIDAWSAIVIKHRVVVLVTALILLVGSVFAARDIQFDHTIERNFVDGDPRLEEFDKLTELFGDSEYLVVGIEARPDEDDIFVPQTLAVIGQISDYLERHEAVTQVRSVTKYEYTRGAGGLLSTKELFDDLSEQALTPQVRDNAKAIVANEPLALGVLVTDDFRHARIAARVRYNNESPAHKVALIRDLYQFVDEQGYEADGYDIKYGGQPVFDEKFETTNKQDADTLYPLMGVIMMLVLFLTFRTLGAVAWPWIVIVFGIAYLTGVQGLLGFPHTAVDQALIPTMIIIGVGLTIHYLVEFYRSHKDGSTSGDAAKRAVRKIWWPAFLTAFTTSVGFLALSVTEIVPVREMAILGAMGPMILFALTFTVLPSLLSYIRRPAAKAHTTVETGYVARLLDRIAPFTWKYRNPILLLGLVIIVFAVATAQAIKVDTNFVEYFKKDNPARQDMIYFDETFRGALTMEVIVDSGEIKGITDPEFLKRVDALQEYLEGLPVTGDINSVLDYLKQVNQSFNQDNPEFYRLPETALETSQLLFLYANAGPFEDLSDLKDFDERFLRLTVPTVNMPASEMEIELDAINRKIDNEFSDLSVSLTGVRLLFQAQDIYTNEGMIKSFGIALFVIFIIFMLVFRSVKYGIVCLVPSILPILTVGGLIALLGVNVDLGTMIVGAMTMGIAVDDTIHFMNRYLGARKEGASSRESVSIAISEAGRAIIFSTIILVLGFSALTLGSFVPIIHVGLFAAGIMFLALIFDLFILPAFLYAVDRKVADEAESADLQSRTI
ncbi:MAG: MMPL family transporter [Reinekea sp.]|nr:MMPL family transporter [Reinekea sp.]